MDEYSRRFFNSLSEKDRRRFAALEAHRRGWHGIKEVSEFYSIHPHTIRRGQAELEGELKEEQDECIRRSGGGRRKAETYYPNIDAAFLQVLRDYTAGSPMDANVCWTQLGDEEIRDRLQEQGFQVGIPSVKRLLKKHGYHRRQAAKKKTFKHDPDRNTQFEQIDAVNQAEADSPNPTLSIDTKKKSI